MGRFWSLSIGGGSNRPVMWGAQHPTKINIRKSLLEFIPKCVERGFLLGLSTWFFGPGSQNVRSIDDFVRVWDETLTFLRDNHLLKHVYYVDLLNEYPLFNGFNVKKWMKDQIDESAGLKTGSSEGEIKKDVHEWKEEVDGLKSDSARKLYIHFSDEVIRRLQLRWPDLDFIFSLTENGSADWRFMAPSLISAIDVHHWVIMNPLLGGKTGYWENIHKLSKTDDPFPEVNEALHSNWRLHRKPLEQWLEDKVKEASQLGNEYKKPVGSTEGWGTINWLDHPSLNWDLIKEAGLLAAKFGRQYGYRFNCSSNFTHPQFKKLWSDLDWHREVTSIIRGLK